MGACLAPGPPGGSVPKIHPSERTYFQSSFHRLFSASSQAPREASQRGSQGRKVDHPIQNPAPGRRRRRGESERDATQHRDTHTNQCLDEDWGGWLDDVGNVHSRSPQLLQKTMTTTASPTSEPSTGGSKPLTQELTAEAYFQLPWAEARSVAASVPLIPFQG